MAMVVVTDAVLGSAAGNELVGGVVGYIVVPIDHFWSNFQHFYPKTQHYSPHLIQFDPVLI
jgi:hypothetical protein